MMRLETTAPDFNLLDTVTGTNKKLSKLAGKRATVIIFICNHCPFVHHINSKLVDIANVYQAKGIQFIAISSNNIESHPQDGLISIVSTLAEGQKMNISELTEESMSLT